MAVVYAFFDESGKKNDHPVVTFAGVVVGQSKLTAFDIAWNELLVQYQIPALHMKHASDLNQRVGPKMIAGQTFEERIDALLPFADCINEHLELGLIQAWDVKGFLAMDQQFKVGMGNPDDPYYIAFARSIVELVDQVPPDDQIRVICDDDPETAGTCLSHFHAICQVDEDVNKKIVSLEFKTDEQFPALQAADIVAYLSRREARLMFYGQDYGFRSLFDHMTKDQLPGKMNWLSMFANEDKVKSLSLQS